MNRLDAIRARVEAAKDADEAAGVTATHVPFAALDLVDHARADIPALLEVVDCLLEYRIVEALDEPYTSGERDALRAALAPLLEPDHNP